MLYDFQGFQKELPTCISSISSMRIHIYIYTYIYIYNHTCISAGPCMGRQAVRDVACLTGPSTLC